MNQTCPTSDASVQPQGEDTIAALATAVGGPVAVIRISGPDALSTGGRAWQAAKRLDELLPRQLHLGRIIDEDAAIDTQALAVYMPAPHTYTGEDTVEIHCHGGMLGARLALQRVLQCGARHADPGEFTKRAFLNGKMDLTQAEAVNDLITAQTEMALRLANRQLQGALGNRINRVYDQLHELLVDIESRLDFPEDEIDWEPESVTSAGVKQARDALTALLASRREGEILRHGIRLVIAGTPNVGKSSLLNAILGRDRAIVTDIPGTTRDTLEELAHIRGIPVKLVDTAGIRESADLVERTGIERSFLSLREAQVVLWVFDASRPYPPQRCGTELPRRQMILVGNKRDQMHGAPDGVEDGCALVLTNALTGEGLDELYDRIEQLIWRHPHAAEPDVAVSARHAAMVDEAMRELADVGDRVGTGEWELVAVSLRAALTALGTITGRTVSPDILGTIFSRFCIGK